MINLFHRRLERLCALAVIGELSAEEMHRVERHLDQCVECQAFYDDLHKIASIDLMVAAPRQMRQLSDEDMQSKNGTDLLANILSRTRASSTAAEKGQIHHKTPRNLRPVRNINMFDKVVTPAGWLLAALLLIAWVRGFEKMAQHGSPSSQARTSTPSPAILAPDPWKLRNQALESQIAAMNHQLTLIRRQVEAAHQSLGHEQEQKMSMAAEQQSLKAQLIADGARIGDLSANLKAVESDLEAERENASTLQERLAEINASFDKQQSEVLHLRKIAATTSVHFPYGDHDIDSADALEIVRARDLHIVDVYDVDHSGNAAKSYGRIYYVDHRLLLFYAFDLTSSGRSGRSGRKAMAFQAWGVGPKNSASPKNLGLFYLDNSQLDRWVLRISDPDVLARIDTLFVTIEPPGGSREPRGHQLLFASLAGPANHP